MQRLFTRPARLWWPLILAMAIVLLPTGKASAQFMGYGGYGYGYPGWGYGGWGWGWGGYGYPGMAYNYGYPGYGLGNIPVYGNYVMAAPGYGMGYGGYGMGYGGYGMGYGGYGMGYGGYGMGYGGFGYMPGGIGMSGIGYWNPMFGVGLTPLGTQSYMYETRVLGRTPRTSARYYNAAYRGW